MIIHICIICYNQAAMIIVIQTIYNWIYKCFFFFFIQTR